MNTRRLIAAGAAALALGGGVAACGGGGSSTAGPSPTAVNPNAPEVNPAGDIPDNQAFVAYAPPGGGFSVKVPEGWSRTSRGGAVTFTDKLNSITVERVPAQVAPTVRDARQTEVPRLRAKVPGFKLAQVTSVTRRPGQGVLISYEASAKPNAVTGKAGVDAVERYVFFHKGHDVVLTLSGPKGADNVDPWRIVTDSVTWR